MTQYFDFMFALSLNIVLFMTGAFLFASIIPKIQNRPRLWQTVLLGGSVGAAGILIYFLPEYLGMEHVINTQIILIAAALLYGGRATGALAYLMMAANVLFMNAPDAVAELVTLTLAVVLVEGYLTARKKSDLKPKHFVATAGLLTFVYFIEAWFLTQDLLSPLPLWIAVPIRCLCVFALSLMAFSISNHELTRTRVEKELSESLDRYQVFLDNSTDLILNCTSDGTITMANRAFYQVLAAGCSGQEQQSIYQLLQNEQDSMEVKRIITSALKEGKLVSREREIHIGRDEKRIYKIAAVPFYRSEGSFSGVTITCNDLTDIRKKEQAIRKIAYYDELTGLPNRSSIMQKLSQAIYYSKQRELKTAVVFIDVDGFKNYNDIFGHFFGDKILIEAGQRFSESLRKCDMVGRLGGDEFVIMIRDIKQKNEVVEIIQRLEERLEEPMCIQDRFLYLSISSGIAFYPDDGKSAEDLLHKADTAMYRAKDLGRNNYQFYDKSMKDCVVHRTELETKLRTAMVNNELALYYQPQYYLGSRNLRGNEVLLRWMNDEVGMIPPTDFIPVAEETGLIHSIGAWTLVEACKQNVAWMEAFQRDLTVSVNISPIQLKQKNFEEMINNALAISGMKPELLELEITESILIDSKAYILRLLENLRERGIKISLDDFGTGYSSLNYLKEAGIDTVKIDKSFIDQIEGQGREASVLKATIELAKQLGHELIAEGVETNEQMRYLEENGCNAVQGYLFEKPLSATGLFHLLERLDLEASDEEKTGTE